MSMSGFGQNSNSFTSAFSPQAFASGLPGVMQGFFGDSGRPYQAAQQAYTPYFEEAKKYQNPFFNSGQQAIPQFQDFLKNMSNPSDFINGLMGKYQESPWAKFQQQQAMRSAQNMGSATGLLGSTPLTQFSQQNAHDIASQDMSQWLQSVLGINTQYGSGLFNEIGTGQNAANQLSQLAGNAGINAGQSAYGEEAGAQQDQNALWAGIAKMFGG